MSIAPQRENAAGTQPWLSRGWRQRLAWFRAMPVSPAGRPRPAWAGNLFQGRRIALLKWDAIGDFVLSTTFLRAAYQLGAGEDVTLFCRAAIADLARDQYPRWRLEVLPPRRRPLGRLYLEPAVRRQLRSQTPFDLMIDLRARRDMGDSVMASWIPARWKIGFANQYGSDDICLRHEDRLYDQLYELPEAPNDVTAADVRNYRFLANLLLPDNPASAERGPHLSANAAACDKVRSVLNAIGVATAGATFLLICPGSLDPLKEYAPTRLANAIRSVFKERPNQVVVAGAVADQRTTRPLLGALHADGIPALDVTGRFNLVEHVALVSLAGAVLSMDSATAHIAGAMGRPAVVLLGGGQPGVFGPWGQSSQFRWLQHPLPCYGCNWSCIYPEALCVQDIPPELIARNLLDAWQAAKP